MQESSILSQVVGLASSQLLPVANPNPITTADLFQAIGNWISITRSYYHHDAVISFLSNSTVTTSFLVTHIGHEKGEICVVHCSISPVCLEGCLETEWQGNHANQTSHQTGLNVMGSFSGTDTNSGTSRKELTLLFRGTRHIAQSLRIYICKRRWHCLERLRQLPWLEKKFPVASQNWLFLTLVEQQCTEED